MPRVAEPLLEQGGGGADHEEGQPHGDGEQQEHVQHRARIARPQEVRVHGQGQDGERNDEDPQMQDRLAWRGAKPRRAGVRIRIARQEGGLEEDHARAPHGRRATEEREDHLAHHGLDDEEQRRPRTWWRSRGAGWRPARASTGSRGRRRTGRERGSHGPALRRELPQHAPGAATVGHHTALVGGAHAVDPDTVEADGWRIEA